MATLWSNSLGSSSVPARTLAFLSSNSGGQNGPLRRGPESVPMWRRPTARSAPCSALGGRLLQPAKVGPKLVGDTQAGYVIRLTEVFALPTERWALLDVALVLTGRG